MYGMDEEARERGGEVGLCAFCRTPMHTSDEEEIKRIKKLMASGNAWAFCHFAGWYNTGDGVPQDFSKANELFKRAGELGCDEGYYNLAVAYYNGLSLEVDKKKAKHFYELAAMNGNVLARHNLGYMEIEAGNYHRANKHFILAAKAGYNDALNIVKKGFMKGSVTKDEYANTLRAHQKARDEMKSDDRDKAEEYYQRESAARIEH